MRTLVLVSFTLAATVAAAGCRPSSNETEQAAFQVPQRDLTLQQADGPQVEVASPVELARMAPNEHRSAARQRAVRRATRAPQRASGPRDTGARTAAMDTPVQASAPAALAPLPVSQAAYEPPDPYALAPGQTVTVLPASSGGSASEPGLTDHGPPDARHGDSGGTTIRGGGHGGSCGGRGHPGSGGSPGLRGLR
ncbi:MAG: hypothetical protein ACREOQ_21075 [Gemmatimonadales bacterium]